MKVAIVVQRYGANISGGAELHARYVAERLAPRIDVRVLTTCARDYLTWRNEFPAGLDEINGVPVERFAVDRERNLEDFASRSRDVFTSVHSLQQELDWLDSQGPVSPGLLARLRRGVRDFDFVILFSARYHQTFHAARIAAERAVLVPTAEREAAIGLSMFQPMFRGVRGIMYNSPEERALIQALAANEHVPDAVVGIGSRIPEAVDPARARQKFGLSGPFVVYVGRIDPNKGCAELFDFFMGYAGAAERNVDLVLIGGAAMPIPQHQRIRHLGYVSDQDKFDVIAAAHALIMPSYYESLSMVTLEAWALGRPVLANARCDVVLGQCLRSNGGLFYENAKEFEATLDTLLDTPSMAATLGRNGREYFQREYSWPVIEKKYIEMFDRLMLNPPPHAMDRLPGWFGRRRRNLPPARDLLAALPGGAVLRQHT